MTLTFHEIALQEFQNAYDWYARQSDTAPARLLQEVEIAAKRICADPESRPTIYDRFRWIKLKHFPYILVYDEIGKGTIKILAFAHTSRRPGYWRGRA
jgi:plasmid stabilization system protein ParE